MGKEATTTATAGTRTKIRVEGDIEGVFVVVRL